MLPLVLLRWGPGKVRWEKVMWVMKMAGNVMLMLVVWNVTMMMKVESRWGLTMVWDLPTGVRLSHTKVMETVHQDSLQLVSPVETQYHLVTN
jgi:hypothetical protein